MADFPERRARVISPGVSTPSTPGLSKSPRDKKRPTVYVDNPQVLLEELKRTPRRPSHTSGDGSDGSPCSSRQQSMSLLATMAEAPSVEAAAGASLFTRWDGSQKKVPPEKENIKVAIRIRPRISRDAHHADVVRVSRDGTTISFKQDSETLSPGSRFEKPGREFTYDYVFDSRLEAKRPASQQAIFDQMGDRIVQGAVEGFNACLFAYGQTGTGKTHTVIGMPPGRGCTVQSQEERGVLPRILEGIFAEVERRRKEGRNAVVKISFLEIYNEMINDLLLPPNRKPGADNQQSLAIRYTPGLGLVINDLSEPVATTFEQAYKLVDFGMKMRSIAATSMNSRSSRAHTVFTFRMEQEDEGGETKMAQVQIIDLAGREQEKTSGDDRERLRERAFINKSLFHLSTCISNLSRSKGKMAEWTFRNSKLTMVLTNSLGKNSRTSMIAAVSPTAGDIEETISTLRFASQVKHIVNVASCNSVNKRDLVSELKAEIDRLKDDSEGGIANAELLEQVAQLESLCRSYQESLGQEQARSTQLLEKQKNALVELGLSADSTSISVKQDQDVPYLFNLSEDPFLEGCLMYFLQQNTETTIGSDRDNKIIIQGLGVSPCHCIIENEDNDTLRVSPGMQSSSLDTDACSGLFPRTFVNGLAVTEATEIKHKDCLILGHAFVFRVHVPMASETRMRACTSLPASACADFRQMTRSASSPTFSSDEKGEDKTLSQALSEVMVQHVSRSFTQHLGAEAGSSFLAELNSALGLLEEANVISREVRPEERLEFRLQLLTDVLCSPMPSEVPAMVVAVFRLPAEAGASSRGEQSQRLRAPSRDSAASQESQVAIMKFVWSFDKFKDRLQAMRDCYEEIQKIGLVEKMKQLAREPYRDPWKEIGGAEVQLLVDGLAPDHDSSNWQNGNQTTTSEGESCSSSSDSESSQEEDDDDGYRDTVRELAVASGGGLDRPALRRHTDLDPSTTATLVQLLSTSAELPRLQEQECGTASARLPSQRNESSGSALGWRQCRSYDLDEFRGKSKDPWYDIGRRRGQLYRRQFSREFANAEISSAASAGVRTEPGSPVSRRRSSAQSWSNVDMNRGTKLPTAPQVTLCSASPSSPLKAPEAQTNHSVPGGLEIQEISCHVRRLSKELQATEAEKKSKMQTWSSQIEAKANLLLQLKENLSQLRSLDSTMSIPKGLAPRMGQSPLKSSIASNPASPSSTRNGTGSMSLPLRPTTPPFFHGSPRGVKMTRFNVSEGVTREEPLHEF